MAKQFSTAARANSVTRVRETLAPALKALSVTCVTALLLTACATTTPSPIRVPTSQPTAETQDPVRMPERPPETGPVMPEPQVTETPTPFAKKGLTPTHMQGRDIKRLALILPFSAQSARLREEAASMMKAAELAVFDRDEADVLLITLDTQGTEAGARNAVQNAVRSGADLILGPILSGSVRAAGTEARRTGTPMIAFSTDQSVAGNGTYLLSFPPEAEVSRIVDYARTLGIKRFAFIGPESEYGRRVSAEYSAQIRKTGGELTARETYQGNDIAVMDAPARRLAKKFGDNEARNPRGAMAFEAVLLPEGGTALRSLAPPLLYYEDGMSQVQFLGTGLWHRDDVVREPALSGGLFAGPDQEARRKFETDYDRTYGEDPSRLASLAFDAVSFGTLIAQGNPDGRRARAEDNRGFFGADGLVRFNSDGTPDRGLAIYQIKNGRFEIVEPAPRTTLGGS